MLETAEITTLHLLLIIAVMLLTGYSWGSWAKEREHNREERRKWPEQWERQMDETTKRLRNLHNTAESRIDAP